MWVRIGLLKVTLDQQEVQAHFQDRSLLRSPRKEGTKW